MQEFKKELQTYETGPKGTGFLKAGEYTGDLILNSNNIGSQIRLVIGDRSIEVFIKVAAINYKFVHGTINDGWRTIEFEITSLPTSENVDLGLFTGEHSMRISKYIGEYKVEIFDKHDNLYAEGIVANGHL
ncbi:MAG: hypothetical protein WBA16_12415 [Nonlabens sp.]